MPDRQTVKGSELWGDNNKKDPIILYDEEDDIARKKNIPINGLMKGSNLWGQDLKAGTQREISLPPIQGEVADLGGRGLKEGLDVFGQAASNTLKTLPGAQRVAQLYDQLPDFRPNEPPTTLADRALVKSLVTKPNEIKTALEYLGYKDVKVSGSGNVTVEGKDVDPSTVLSLQELFSEGLENANLAIEAAGSTGGLTAAATSGLMGVARENLKEKTFPGLKADYSQAAWEGGLSGVGQLGTSAVKSGINKWRGGGKLAKDLTKKGIDTTTEFIEKDGSKTVIGEAVFGFVDDLTGQEAKARGIGATPKLLKVFNNKPITYQIQKLRELSPEFDKATKAFTVKGKRDGTIKVLVDESNNLKNFYNEYGKALTVKNENFFKSEPYQEILKTLKSKTTENNVVKEIDSVRKRFLNYMAKMSLPDEEFKLLNTPMIRQARESLYDQVGKPIQSAPPKFYKGMPLNELEKGLSEYPINIDNVWSANKFLNDEAKWGSLIKEESRFKTEAFRQLANTLRSGLHQSIKDAPIDNMVKSEFLKSNEIVHNLIPVVDMIDSYASKKVGKVDFTKLLPSQIGSTTRKTLDVAKKLQTDAGRNLIGTGSSFIKDKIPKVTGLTMDSIPNILPAAENLAKMGRIAASKHGALSREQAQPIEDPYAYKQPSTAPELRAQVTPEDIKALLTKAQTPKLPRSPELLMSDPTMYESLAENLSPDTNRLLSHAVESKDPFKLRMAMSIAVNEAPDFFEPSITGNNSEMMIGDHYVIVDPKEGEVYLQSILSRLEMGDLDYEFAAKQISALNNPRDMRVFPLPNQTPRAPEPVPEPSSKLNELKQTITGMRKQYSY